MQHVENHQEPMHPLADVALSVLVYGESERYTLDEQGMFTLAGAFQKYFGSQESLMPATQALIDVAFHLETTHNCTQTAHALVQLAGTATEVLEAQLAAVNQDAASAGSQFNRFTGSQEKKQVPRVGLPQRPSTRKIGIGKARDEAPGARVPVLTRAPRRV